MEYQENNNNTKKNCWTTHQINHLNLEQKTGSKSMMNQEEHAILVLKLSLKH